MTKLAWHKSSYSGSQAQCVEVAELPDGTRLVRDSKNRKRPVLTVTADSWRQLVASIKQSL